MASGGINRLNALDCCGGGQLCDDGSAALSRCRMGWLPKASCNNGLLFCTVEVTNFAGRWASLNSAQAAGAYLTTAAPGACDCDAPGRWWLLRYVGGGTYRRVGTAKGTEVEIHVGDHQFDPAADAACGFIPNPGCAYNVDYFKVSRDGLTYEAWLDDRGRRRTTAGVQSTFGNGCGIGFPANPLVIGRVFGQCDISALSATMTFAGWDATVTPPTDCCGQQNRTWTLSPYLWEAWDGVVVSSEWKSAKFTDDCGSEWQACAGLLAADFACPGADADKDVARFGKAAFGHCGEPDAQPWRLKCSGRAGVATGALAASVDHHFPPLTACADDATVTVHVVF